MESDLMLGFFIILLIIFSAIFSSMETAFSSVNFVRIKSQSDDGNKKAKIALHIINNYDKALTTILIGNNIVNISASSLATILCLRIFGDYGAAISTGLITLLVLIFGEILPKCLAKKHNEKLCYFFGSFLKVLMTAFTPLSIIFMSINSLVIKSKSGDNTQVPTVTESELKYIIESIEEEGVLEEQESELVHAALDFDEKIAKDILTPRVYLTAIDIDDTDENIKNIIFTERFSRIPVYKNTIDNVVGILHSRDYLESLSNNGDYPNLEDLIQPAHFIYKTKKLSSILAEFKKEKHHICIVTDEYGGTLGIITMEDLLEEIVGDIWDEDEEVEKNVTVNSDGCYNISGDMDLDELADLLELKKSLFLTESNSVGGWVSETLGDIPEESESFNFENYNIKILEMDEQRIKTVLISKNNDIVSEVNN